MAGEMGVSMQALSKWIRSRESGEHEPTRRTRPGRIPAHARWRIRQCYLSHYRTWGPRVLAHWAEREGLGKWSPTTIGKVIEDLREEAEPRPEPVRYEIVASGVMWSEDGTGFREHGRKKELIVLQDDHARFKVNHSLPNGPANEDAVHDYLAEAFEKHGAPLVLKHDGDSIFHGKRIKKLLEDYEVTELTGPRAYPQYNGKKERSMRDIKTYERAMRRHGVRGTLESRIRQAIEDLNHHRPRPVLGGCTAQEVFYEDRIPLPSQSVFRREVKRTKEKLLEEAESRRQKDSAGRRAVELVLLRYSLMEIMGDVSTNSEKKTETF